MRKLLTLNDFSKGGRTRDELYDLLGLRIIVHPRQVAEGDSKGGAVAEADAVQVW